MAHHTSSSVPSAESPRGEKPEIVDGGVISSESSESLPPARMSKGSRLWRHLTSEVEPSFLVEVELIILTFCTGLQDAISFPDYHCFASNQTGNTVFLTLALILPTLNGEMFVLQNIGVALGFFLGGGWLTGQLGHIVGPRCRLWLIVCNFLQTCLVFTAAALQYVYGVQLQSTVTLVVLSLLALAAGSQVVQSRAMSLTEISTAMATAAWIDLLIDPNLFSLRNRPRTRRAVFLLTLVLGSLVGAVIYRNVGSAAAIAISASGKLLVTVLYFFNQAKERKTDGEGVAV